MQNDQTPDPLAEKLQEVLRLRSRVREAFTQSDFGSRLDTIRLDAHYLLARENPVLLQREFLRALVQDVTSEIYQHFGAEPED